MNLPALLCALALGLGVGAQQGKPRVRQGPYGVEVQPAQEEGRWPHYPPGIRCVSPSGFVEQWWHWNRDRFLPAPAPARAGLVTAEPQVGTGIVPAEQRWLLAAARAAAPEVRAGALYVLGCAGAGAGGQALLVAALDDGDVRVRQAAILGLGEHGGTRARFTLLRAMANGERPRPERQLAMVAYGLAAAIDGIGGGLELRRQAAVTEDVELRAGLSVADLLFGAAGRLEVASQWRLEGLGHRLALALPCAVRGSPPALARAVLAAGVKSKDAPLRFAARAVSLGRGEVPKEVVQQWLKSAHLRERGRIMLAAIGHPDFVELVTPSFSRPFDRDAAALAFAVHARQLGLAEAASQLSKFAALRRNAASRPLWLLAAELAGDANAAAQARLVLQGSSADLPLRLAAANVLALAGGECLEVLRHTVAGDAFAVVRCQAADGLARHARHGTVAVLQAALAKAVDDHERASLLRSLGRTRATAALPILHRHAVDLALALGVREAAWAGLALHRRWSGASRLGWLPRGVAYVYLPSWLLQLVDRSR